MYQSLCADTEIVIFLTIFVFSEKMIFVRTDSSNEFSLEQNIKIPRFGALLKIPLKMPKKAKF